MWSKNVITQILQSLYDFISTLVTHLKDTLKSISLSRCFSILPEDYLKFSAMKKLQNLNIYGMLQDHSLEFIKKRLPQLSINECLFSTIARPATGNRRNLLWEIKFPQNKIWWILFLEIV